MYTEINGEALRLRWRFEGRKYSLSLGLKNTLLNQATANELAARIERDMQAGYFDSTLLKYRPKTTGTNPSEVSAVQLFKKFTTAKNRQKRLAPGSLDRYQAIAANLQRYMGDKPARSVTEAMASDMLNKMAETLSASTIKAYLSGLNACWDWAEGKYHIAEVNPWKGLKAWSNILPKQPDDPFTRAEISVIHSAFRQHPVYSHYADFVLFLFGTGCRPGEAAGLRWENFASDFSTVWIGESISRGHRKDTKTGKARTVLLNSSVRSMLAERLKGREGKGLVFMSPKGSTINDRNFCQRAWANILAECGVNYRPPYNIRHSTTSHTLDTGVNPIALAEQMGHNKEVLLRTYAHAIDSRSLFPDFLLSE
jgi:integrase